MLQLYYYYHYYYLKLYIHTHTRARAHTSLSMSFIGRRFTLHILLFLSIYTSHSLLQSIHTYFCTFRFKFNNTLQEVYSGVHRIYCSLLSISPLVKLHQINFKRYAIDTAHTVKVFSTQLAKSHPTGRRKC